MTLTAFRTFFAAALTTLAFIACPVHAASEYVDYSDIWIDVNTPANEQAGFGINFVQSGNSFDFIFATLFIYDTAGNPTWLTGQLTRDSSGTFFLGPLYHAQSAAPTTPFDPVGTSVQQVGTFKFTPTSSTTGTMEYTVGSTSVIRTLTRLTLTENVLNGTYWGGAIVSESKCSPSSANGSSAPSMTVKVEKQTGSTQASFIMYMTNNVTCTLKGTLKQEGRFSKINNASYVCTQGNSKILDTTANIFNITPTTQGLEGEWSSSKVTYSCQEEGHFVATIVPTS